MEQNRRARIYKRPPLYRRIIDAPEDYLTKVENDFRALDWDMLQEGFSWPLAVGLNVMLASVKLGYWLDDPMANVPAVLKQDRLYYSKKSMYPGFVTLLAALQYILVAISFVNAIWLFRSKKNYTLLLRDLDERPSSSSAKIVEFQQDESHWSFKFPGKFIYPFISMFIRSSKPEESKRQVWELSLWNPSILSRNLFCWYSPAQVLILAFMTSDNFYVFFPLSIAVALQIHFLVSVYQSYVKDKEILFSEVYNEYNAKFVHPTVFVRKYDKMVSTETETTDDFQYYAYQDQDQGRDYDHSSHFTPERKQRNFQYLSVPASSYGMGSATSRVRSRKPDANKSNAIGRRSSESYLSSRSASANSSRSGHEEDDDDEDHGSNRVDDEEEEDSSSESDSENEVSDPDVEHDEEGEEPTRPHPTNSLSTRSKYY